MKKLLSVIILLSVSLLFAAKADKCWVSVEELKKGDKTLKQYTYIQGDLLRTVSEKENSKADLIVDFSKDSMIIINHNDKSYQIMKISEYTDFVTKLVESMVKENNAKPKNYDIKYTLVADDTVGIYSAKKYKVNIEGKDRFYVWVSPALKNNVIKDATARVTKLLPASLLEYKNLLQKVKDHFENEGLVVKTEKINNGNHGVATSQTLVEFKEIPVTKATFAVPSDYVNKTQESKKTK